MSSRPGAPICARAAEAIGDRTALEAAIVADRKKLRAWLRDLLSRPVVIEALHLATPALLEALRKNGVAIRTRRKGVAPRRRWCATPCA